MYAKYFKRIFDFVLSLFALIVFLPLFLVLIIVGGIKMKGNPFFIQERPGKKDKNGNEKIFKLIKFRTMSNEKDKSGNLLLDEKRLTSYGKFLRKTSIDELPSLVNMIKGDISVVGPRPLLVKYLPLYTEEQRHRHDVRPGLTGYAQVNGRNTIAWEEKFDMDLEYVYNGVNLINDLKIVLDTVIVVFKHSGINAENCATMDEFKGTSSSLNHEEIVL